MFLGFLIILLCLSARARSEEICTNCYEMGACPPCRSASTPEDFFIQTMSVFQPPDCDNDNGVRECGGNSVRCVSVPICTESESKTTAPFKVPEQADRTTSTTTHPETTVNGVDATVPGPPFVTVTVSHTENADVPRPPMPPSPIPATTFVRSLFSSSSTLSSKASSLSSTDSISADPGRLTLPEVSLTTGNSETKPVGTSGGELISSQDVINAPTGPTPPTTDNTLLIGAIVGGVLGCLLLLGILFAVIVTAKRRHHDSTPTNTNTNANAIAPSFTAVATSTPIPPHFHDYAAVTLPLSSATTPVPHQRNLYDGPNSPFQMTTRQNLYDEAMSPLHS